MRGTCPPAPGQPAPAPIPPRHGQQWRGHMLHKPHHARHARLRAAPQHAAPRPAPRQRPRATASESWAGRAEFGERLTRLRGRRAGRPSLVGADSAAASLQARTGRNRRGPLRKESGAVSEPALPQSARDRAVAGDVAAPPEGAHGISGPSEAARAPARADAQAVQQESCAGAGAPCCRRFGRGPTIRGVGPGLWRGAPSPRH